MICKRDVILWFKELESYKRIDIMCTLLNMCLPFELRFLGTCLEELGRRDSQELRGIELRVNNPQELASDMIACQKGEPTDKKIRRKMALYLALIRACNRICVTEIFRTLDGWGDRDFINMSDTDTLQELLLVYTMAANHPVFSFEQHMKCTEIFERIRENKLICPDDVTTTASTTTTIPHLAQQLETLAIVSHPELHPQMAPPPSHPAHEYLQQSQQIPPPPNQQQPHSVQTLHIAGQNSQILTPIQMVPPPQNTISINYLPTHLAKIMPGDGSMQQPHPTDAIAHMSNINIPTDSPAMLTHGNPAWPQYPIQAQTVEHPPQSNSPLLSQQSSPSSSRTTSPTRSSNTSLMNLQQGRSLQRIGSSLKSLGRPSSDTTPPPTMPPPQVVPADVILPHALKNMEDESSSSSSVFESKENDNEAVKNEVTLKEKT